MFDGQVHSTTDSRGVHAWKVSDVMTRAPIVLHERAPLASAKALFSELAIGAAPVIDETGRSVGVLSVRDLLLVGPTEEDHREVADLMTPYVISIPAHASIRDAVSTMRATHIHHLPVVEEGGRVVGIVTALDIASAVVLEAHGPRSGDRHDGRGLAVYPEGYDACRSR